MVLVKSLQSGVLVELHFIHHEWSGAYWALPELGLLECQRIFAFKMLLRQWSELCESQQRVWCCLCKSDFNLLSVNLDAGDFFCFSIHKSICAFNGLEGGGKHTIKTCDLQCVFDGPLYVVCSDLLTVMPVNFILQCHGQQ